MKPPVEKGCQKREPYPGQQVAGDETARWHERSATFLSLCAHVFKDHHSGAAPSKEDILSFMEGKIAKWWMPDDVAFVDEIPHTATGKISKLQLREKFTDYVLPSAGAAE